jgi:hypothetical protein
MAQPSGLRPHRALAAGAAKRIGSPLMRGNECYFQPAALPPQSRDYAQSFEVRYTEPAGAIFDFKILMFQ